MKPKKVMMKHYTITKLLKNLSLIGFIILSVSCSKNELIKYDTSQKDGVYFDTSKSTDSIFYNFGFDENTTMDVEIPVYLMGLPVSHDRVFKVSLDNDKYVDETVVAATSEYYDIPETITLKADSVSITIPVTLKRHPDLEDLRAIMTINLEPTEDLDIRGHSEYTITFDDKTPPTPAWWASFWYGEFTKFKGQLFFRYFKEIEQEDKAVYDLIVKRWGEYLTIEPNAFGDNPLFTYMITFAKYVQQKMYDYSLDNPQLNLNISEPEY